MNTSNVVAPQDGPWSSAFNKLDPEPREILKALVKEIRGDILTAVLKEAESKKQLCLQKRWKVQFRGKTIVLRDLFDKIIAWVNKFASVVDVAVQFDPVSASLPWAGVRFLLQVAVSDHQCFEFIVHGLETVSLMIARYAAFEELYLQKGSVIHAELERGLTSLYARILTFLARGAQYFEQSTALRLVKSVFQTSQNEDIDEIIKLDEEVVKLAQIVDSQKQQQILVQVAKVREVFETLQRPICRLVDISETHTKTLQLARFHEIIGWLSSEPHSHHHKRHSESRLPKSAQWIFRHQQYMDWKGSSSSAIFLLHGIPGSGKTSVTSAVVDEHLNEQYLNPLSAPVAYFYCGDSLVGQSRADPEEVIRSLTRQFAIVDKSKLKVHEHVALEYARKEAEAKLDGFEIPRLRSAQCADLILSILGTNPAVIIVDGVDEIEETRRHELLDALVRIRDESASVVKIFLSSRDNSHVFASLPDASMLRVQETHNHQDMELFVEHCVSTAISTRNLLDGNMSDDLREGLTRFLLNRAGEMFLWVQLQMESLCKMKSMSSVSETVAKASTNATEIDVFYSEILENLKQTDSPAYTIASRAFSWLLRMREPLSSGAFIDAVSNATPDTHGLNLTELLSICSNLIVHDKQLDIMRFSHVSFKEFLEKKPEFNRSSAHMIATLSCIEACIQKLPLAIEGEICPRKYYDLYAVIFWAEHCSLAMSSGDARFDKKLEEFIVGDDGFMFQLWLEAAKGVSKLLPRGHILKSKLNEVLSMPETPFFTACVFGLNKVFDISVETLDFNVNAVNFAGHTGFYLAAALGHGHLMKRFLELAADPIISHGKYRDPLSAASAGGHASVVDFLLGQKVYSSSMNIEEALRVSFLAGHEEISRTLIKRYLNQADGGKKDLQNDNSWLLEAAAQVGFTEALSELTKGFQSSPLSPASSFKLVHAAIRKGRIDIIKKLIEKDSLPADVIATAALFGKIEIINLCSNEGYSVEAEGPFGTSLRCASLMGHEKAVWTLVYCGANVNAITPLGDALQAASMKGHISITKILIQLRADVNNPGGLFGNALQAAAYRGHQDVVKALLDAGAHMEMSGRYTDAFHAAAEAGRASIVSLFIKMGYTFSPQDIQLSDGSAGLAISRHSRHLWRAGLLIYKLIIGFSYASASISQSSRRVAQRHGIPKEMEPATADSNQSTHIVADFERVIVSSRDVLTPLIDQPQAAYKSTHCWGRFAEHCALEVAASRGHLEAVKMILAARKSLYLEKHHLGYALWEASTKGYPEIVKCITAEEINLRSFSLGSMERASRNGHMETVNVLIQYEDDQGFQMKDMAEPEYNSWQNQNSNGVENSRQHMLNGFSKSRYALMSAIASCRREKLSSVVRKFQLADQPKTKRLRELALIESAQSDRIDILELLLGSPLHFASHAMYDAIRAAKQHDSARVLPLLLQRDKASGSKRLLSRVGRTFDRKKAADF